MFEKKNRVFTNLNPTGEKNANKKSLKNFQFVNMNLLWFNF